VSEEDEAVPGRSDKSPVGKVAVDDVVPAVEVVSWGWVVVPGMGTGSLNGLLEVVGMIVGVVEVWDGRSLLSSTGVILKGTPARFIGLHSHQHNESRFHRRYLPTESSITSERTSRRELYKENCHCQNLRSFHLV